MNIDWKKISNSKAFNIAIIIGLPAIVVAGYYGYRYYQKRKSEKSLTNKLALKKEECKNVGVINSYNDFYEAVKCLDNTTYFGYDLRQLIKDVNFESKISIDDARKIIELAKIGITKLTEEQSELFLSIMHKIRP